MVLYKCVKCDKIFKQKSHYNSHINKKYPCDKTYVNLLNNNANTKKQLANNKLLSNNKNESNMDNINNDICNIADPKDMLISELKTTISVLAGKIDMLTEKLNKIESNNGNNTIDNSNNNNTTNSNNTNSNNTVNNIVNNNTHNIINIVPYGKEDLSFITDPEYKKFLNSGFNSIKEFIKVVHFNEDRPENHNMCIPAEKRPLVYVFNGKQWEKCEKSEFIDQIIDDKFNLLEEKFNKLNKNKELDEPIVNKFEKVIDGIEDNKKRKYVKNGIALQLYNNKDMVLETKKKNEDMKKNTSCRKSICSSNTNV